MENANASVENATAEGSVVESQSAESAESTAQQTINPLEAQMANLTRMVEQLSSAVQPKAEAPKQYTTEELNQMYTTNPVGVISQLVNQSTTQNMTVVKKEMERNRWLDQTSKEFPVKDPAFDSQLRASWNTLVDGGLDANSPKAVYLAAQHASMVLATKKAAPVAKTNNVVTSEGEGTVPMKTKSTATITDPAVAIYAMAVKDPKKIEEFRKQREKLKQSSQRR